MRVLLVVYALVVLVGCGADDTFSNIQYPNAPIISIKQTKLTWHDKGLLFQYRLEAKEPLPYDIEVKIAVNGTSQSADGQVHAIWGLQHLHEGQDWHIHENDYHLLMRSGTSTLGTALNSLEVGRWIVVVAVYNLSPEEYRDSVANNQDPPLYVNSINLKIAPWSGFGDAAYNVGHPHTLMVKR